MKKAIFLFIIIIFALLSCGSVFASSGIVPCGGESDPCTLCHLIVGISNLVNWGKNILVTVTIVGIFISGIIYVVSSGNEKMIARAKSFLSASLVGFSVTLAAWLIVNVTIFWVANAKSDLNIGITNWYTFTCDTTSSANGTASTEDLTVDPSEITFEKTGDTKQIKVSYKDNDVTKSATYESKDKDIATVSSEGLVTNKADFEEGDTEPKETTITVTYNGSSKTISVIATSGTCPVNSTTESSGAAPEFSMFISKVYAADEWEIGVSPQETTLAKIKESSEKKLNLEICVKNPSKIEKPRGIWMFYKNGTKNVAIRSDDFRLLDSGSKLIAGFSYSESMLPTVYNIVIQDSSGSSHLFEDQIEIKDEDCKFVYGNKNAKFILILARINTHFVGLPSQPCSDSLETWDTNNEDQADIFREKVSLASSGVNVNNLADNFGVYRSNKVFETTEKNICPDVESGKEFVSYGWVQNGSGKSAYAEIGGNNSYYCIKNIKPVALAHEQIGHNFALLMDEYILYNETFSEKKYTHNYNCTADKTCTKWQKIEAGCYSGCFTPDGYRSAENNLMKDTSASGFSTLQEYIIKKTIENYPYQASVLQNLDE